MKTATIVRPAITLIDRKVATLNQLRSALVALGRFTDSYQPARKPKKRTLSPAARRKISIAQKARWAKYHRAGKVLHMRRAG